VPLHLCNAPTDLMKQQGYATGYLYAHDYPNHFVAQDYLPPELKGTQLYKPADNARERESTRLHMERWGKKP